MHFYIGFMLFSNSLFHKVKIKKVKFDDSYFYGFLILWNHLFVVFHCAGWRKFCSRCFTVPQNMLCRFSSKYFAVQIQ